jgi:ornithine carbamoyltransferase
VKSPDFLSAQDISTEEILDLFRLAKDMKADRKKYLHSHEGACLAMIFEKPSLRTRVTFDVGIRQLGGTGIFLGPSDINLGKRESVYDVAKNLERMVDIIMIRTFAHSICTGLAEYARIPVINGLTDLEHPCQALADLFTMWEIKGDLKGKKLAYVGDGNNVAHSLLITGARLGVHVSVGTPKGYEPQKEIVAIARRDAEPTGATIAVTNDPTEAVAGADAVYTDVWASMGQESEAEQRKKVFQPYQVNASLMANAQADAIFLHCLPAHRGEEVTDEVIDSPQSVVFQEAENRLHVQKALIHQLLQ